MDKIPNKILVASGNKGKIKEISNLLSDLSIQAIGPDQIAKLKDTAEPEETGSTFAENSLIKARYYGEISGLPSLADDSGFCVHDLDNEPGIYSARFAVDSSGNRNFPMAFEKIYQQLDSKNVSIEQNPTAHFVCNLTFYNPETKLHKSFEGRVDGTITKPIGDLGFGYDPIFIKNGMKESFAQIEPFEKDKISHRGQAFNKLKSWLQQIEAGNDR